MLTRTDERHPQADDLRPILQDMESLQGEGCTEIVPRKHWFEDEDNMKVRNRRGFEDILDHYEYVKSLDSSVDPCELPLPYLFDLSK